MLHPSPLHFITQLCAAFLCTAFGSVLYVLFYTAVRANYRWWCSPSCSWCDPSCSWYVRCYQQGPERTACCIVKAGHVGSIIVVTATKYRITSCNGDRGSAWCIAAEHSTTQHDGGSARCIIAERSTTQHDGGSARCIVAERSTTQHDGGSAWCIVAGQSTTQHDGGSARCIVAEQSTTQHRASSGDQSNDQEVLPQGDRSSESAG